MVQKGFIAVFEEALGKPQISECVASWLERFEKVEQVIPKMEGTLEVKEPSEIMWEPNLQFRVLNGEQFAWVYVSLDKRGDGDDRLSGRGDFLLPGGAAGAARRRRGHRREESAPARRTGEGRDHLSAAPFSRAGKSVDTSP